MHNTVMYTTQSATLTKGSEICEKGEVGRGEVGKWGNGDGGSGGTPVNRHKARAKGEHLLTINQQPKNHLVFVLTGGQGSRRGDLIPSRRLFVQVGAERSVWLDLGLGWILLRMGSAAFAREK